MKLLLEIYNWKYSGILITLLISYAGLYFLEWELYQLFFFLLISHLVRVPFIWLTFKQEFNKIPGAVGGFTIVYTGAVIIFFVIFIGVVHFSHPVPFGYFDEVIVEFQYLTTYYGLPLLGIVLVEFLSFRKTRQLEKDFEQDSEHGFLFKHAIYMALAAISLWVLAAIFRTSYASLYSTGPIILGLLAAKDYYWIKKGGIYSVKPVEFKKNRL